jgi:hypothetical protein
VHERPRCTEQLRELERLWYRLDERSLFARRLLPLMVRAGAKKGIIVKIGDREVPFRV